MKKITRIHLLILSLILFLGSCSSEVSQTTQAGEPPAKSNENKEPKELVIGYGMDLGGVNPKDAISVQTYPLFALYDTLVTYDDGHFRPNLAQEWTVNEDKTEYIFHLKEGIRFSDGTPFNAEALKKNLDAMSINPKVKWVSISANFKSVEILDEYKVKLVLTKPSHFILNDLSSHKAAIMSPSMITIMDP